MCLLPLQLCNLVLLSSGTIATIMAPRSPLSWHSLSAQNLYSCSKRTPSRRPASLSVKLHAGDSSVSPTAIKSREEKRRPVKAQINLGPASLFPSRVDGPDFEVSHLILDLLKRCSLESRGLNARSYWPPAMFPHHCASSRLFLFQNTSDNNKNHIFLPFLNVCFWCFMIHSFM